MARHVRVPRRFDVGWCYLTIESTRGSLHFVRWRPDDPRPPTLSREWPGVGLYRSGYGGDDVLHGGKPFFGTATIVAIADWLPAAPLMAIVGVQLIARLRRGRPARVGHCRACGYDLRASPDRCPECGRSPAGA